MEGQFEWLVLMVLSIGLLGYTLYTIVNVGTFLADYFRS
jgi:hypothetical protein